jgi:hypothetical protein
MSQKYSPGRRCYEAYCEARSWKSFDGEVLPTWNAVKTSIQQAWEKAAQAARQNVPAEEIGDRLHPSRY